MSLYYYFTGQQYWKDHINNLDLTRRLETAVTSKARMLLMKSFFRLLLVAGAALTPGAAAQPVAVRIDATRPKQTIEGFGATVLSSFQGETDTLSEAEKKTSADALLGAVRINLGNVDYYVAENARNDNDNPNVLNWSGFRRFPGGLLRHLFAGRVAPAQVEGFFPGKLNVNATPWLKQLRGTNYEAYLDECAELMLAWVKAWEEDWGRPPAWVMPFNEPTSGNRELGRTAGAEADREMADVLKRAGKRLRAASYNKVMFVFPNQETIERSIESASNVLADQEARQYIGRIGFHEYPYRSALSSVKKILERADGTGEYGVVEERTRLKRMAETYGIPLWMTEVSRGGIEYKVNGVEADCRDFRLLRGRANHIHSEFVVTGATAFFAMNHAWSRKAHALHYKGRGGEDGEGAFSLEADTLFMTDDRYGLFLISASGYAIGHFARWMTPGATVVLPAVSDQPRLRASAYFDRKLNRHVVLLLNNEGKPRQVRVQLAGAEFQGRIGGEQSTETAYWEGVRAFRPSEPHTISVTVPAYSITTLADGMPASRVARAPAVAAGRSQRLPAGSKEATLAGTARDGDGTLRWHAWVLESGPAPVVIEDRIKLNTSVKGLRAGDYVFRLYACDNDWRLGSSSVRVSVARP